MKRLNKILVWVGVILLFALISFFVYRDIEKKESVKFVSYPETLVVSNYTRQANVEPMCKAVLHLIYGIDTIDLDVYDMPVPRVAMKIDISGFTLKSMYEPHKYNVYINSKGIDMPLEQFIAHEMIHIHQMETGVLVPMDNMLGVIYKGDSLYYDIPYEKRPWELDALSEERKIRGELLNILY